MAPSVPPGTTPLESLGAELFILTAEFLTKFKVRCERLARKTHTLLMTPNRTQSKKLSCCKQKNRTKGQLSSKCLFGVFNSPKKRKKQFDLRYHSSKVEFFVGFLGELKILKRHFEIN